MSTLGTFHCGYDFHDLLRVRRLWNEPFKSHDRFNLLLIVAPTELDEKKRVEIYHGMQPIVRDNCPTAVQIITDIVVAANKKLGYENFGTGLDLDGGRWP